MKRILITCTLILVCFLATAGTNFSDRQKAKIYTEVINLLAKYETINNEIAKYNGVDQAKVDMLHDMMLKLFLNRNVFVYNDLDPTGTLSKAYEVETYLSNMILWYGQGINMEFDLSNIKAGKIHQHKSNIYYLDVIVQKDISGSFQNRTMNNTTKNLSYRIAFIKKRGSYVKFKIVGVRDASDTKGTADLRALDELSNVNISEEEISKIRERCKTLINDYTMAMTLIGSPDEPVEDKELYRMDLETKFSDSSATVYNDLEPDGKETALNIEKYLDLLQKEYPKGINTFNINLDSAVFGQVEKTGPNRYYTYLYADKLFSGQYKGKQIHKDAGNYVYRIMFEDNKGNYSLFTISSIEKLDKDYSGISTAKFEDKDFINIKPIGREKWSLTFHGMGGISSILDQNLTTPTLTENYYNWSNKPGNQYQAGIGLDYFFNQHMGIETGITYEKYSHSYNLNGEFIDGEYTQDAFNEIDFLKIIRADNYDTTLTLDYISIPLHFIYITGAKDRFSFYTSLGLNIGYLIKSNYHVTGDYQYLGYYESAETNVLRYREVEEWGFYDRNDIDNQGSISLKKVNLSASAAIGVEIPIGYYGSFRLGPKYILGLNSLSNSSVSTDIFNREIISKPVKTSIFGFELCYVLKL
ncbi:MAG: outer membrane beta-barrel protein [Bacteroidales bacterium]|nr:outer membrane beta-barrel protein [Bacteroidales bacterium]